MGSMPMRPLLLRNAVPLMLSLLTYSLCSFVDSIFVSRLSVDALTAISLAAPVQALIAALGLGIAVGLNATISKAMGEGDQGKVRDTASAALFLALCAWILVSIACVIGVVPFFRWQAAGSDAVYSAGTSYLRICMLCSFGQLTQWVFDRFLIATGRSRLFLLTLSTASAVHLMLDPILIFGGFGLPGMGTAGAALATVIGQCCGGLMGIFANAKWNKEIPARFALRVSWWRVADILRVGVPVAIMQSVVGFGSILLNTMLRAFSLTAVAVMGVCTRLQPLALIPANGINNALIPIAAYNMGASDSSRVRQAIHWALCCGFALMGAVLLLLEVFPTQILRWFEASDAMLDIGVPAIRTLGLGYFLSVLGLVFSTSFQALGKGHFSMYLTLFRQVVLPLGLVFLVSRAGNLALLWLAFPLSELLSAPVALLLMRSCWRVIWRPQACPLDAAQEPQR